MTCVEVKHGKERLEFHLPTDAEAPVTVGWLMGALEERSGVLRKHQKLICKGKVLEAERPIAEQCRGKAGRATVMLMASVGGGGAPPPPPTAGQAALAASRAAKAAKLAEARANGTRAEPAPPRESADVEAARRASWSKTGIVGLRQASLDDVPDEVWALGASRDPSRAPADVVAEFSRRRVAWRRVASRPRRLRVRPPNDKPDILVRHFSDTHTTVRPLPLAGDAARAVDLHGNRLVRVPSSVRLLSSLTRLRVSDNALSLEGVPWSALASLGTLTVLHLDGNRLTGELPVEVGTLTRLETLTLDENRLERLPDAIGSLTRLERLSFAGNRVDALPATLGACERLVAVDARRNRVRRVPRELAAARRLRTLLLDHNLVDADGVPSELLRDATSLDELSLRGCPAAAETLRELDGWDTYDERRRKRAGKVLESRVMLGERAFDEGADAERFRRH